MPCMCFAFLSTELLFGCFFLMFYDRFPAFIISYHKSMSITLNKTGTRTLCGAVGSALLLQNHKSPFFCINPHRTRTHHHCALCFFILNFKIQMDHRLFWDIVSVGPMVTKPQHFSKLGLLRDWASAIRLRLTWGKLKHYSVVLLVKFITNYSVVIGFFPLSVYACELGFILSLLYYNCAVSL